VIEWAKVRNISELNLLACAERHEIPQEKLMSIYSKRGFIHDMHGQENEMRLKLQLFSLFVKRGTNKDTFI